MKDQQNEAWVYCFRCIEKGKTNEAISRCRKEEVQETDWGKWTCHKCRSEIIDLRLVDFIKNRISVTATEDEDRSKFIFRELLQNADDVKSTILVLRFEQDALYVANNGRSFTTTSFGNNLCDFDKISNILGRHQAEDKETVGHFGSGFQTVYAITNSPEVHSSGISGQMNPSRKTWVYLGGKMKRVSPYIHQEIKGVLFRFPWRDNTRAEEMIEGTKIFEDPNSWPRWGESERWSLFEDLATYLSNAIICCQFLKAIRLIWNDGRGLKGFQAVRNFTLRNEDELTDKKSWFEGEIKQGFIEPKDWKEPWEDSFQVDSWVWSEEVETFRYLIGRSNVTGENGRRLFIGKKTDGAVIITQEKTVLKKELKRGDVYVLLPLFDVSKAGSASNGRQYLYSVIPLPRRGLNQFVFSGHFFPTEDRKDVDMEGYGGVTRDWCQAVITSVLGLYRFLFPRFIDEVKGLDVPSEKIQEIILNSIPAVALPYWIRPGREKKDGWWEESYAELIRFILNHQILLSKNEWISPTMAFWAKNAEEDAALRTINARTFNPVFANHPHFKSSLSINLEDCKLSIDTFLALWNDFKDKNQNTSGNLVYQQEIKGVGSLDKTAIDSLITYCITRRDVMEATTTLPIVPGKDNVLRSVRDYPVLPSQLEFMTEIMPESMIIHDEFSFLGKVAEEERTLSSIGVIELVDKIARQDSVKFGDLSPKKHEIFSKILGVLVNEMDFSLNDKVKEMKFIPYKKGVKVALGHPNVKLVKGQSELNRGNHAGEYYQRESIFGEPKKPVPGLTKEVEGKLKFLSLPGCDEGAISKIENELSIEKLIEFADTPTNFVRHFLSPRHGSLFIDENLQEFIKTDDKEIILRNKKSFQNALQKYFDAEKTESPLTPKDMSRVPSLYDESGNWYENGKFALDMYPELQLIGYKSLHKELQEWPP